MSDNGGGILDIEELKAKYRLADLESLPPSELRTLLK